MTGRIWSALALALVVTTAACKKDDAKPPTGGTAGTAAATATGGPAGTATASGTAATAGTGAGAAADCKAACAYRATCTGDAATQARCTEDCEGLSVIPGALDLAGYLALDCAQVKAQDPAVQMMLGCGAACRRRAACLPAASDVAGCVGDCAALATVIGLAQFQPGLDAGRTDACEVFTQNEPTMQLASACLASCSHALSCGVQGTFEGCLGECIDGVQQQQLSLDDVRGIKGQDCAVVKANVKLASAPPPPPVDGVDVGACLSSGAQTCSPFMMCCRLSEGRATRRGEPGLCTYAAVCFGPTR